MNTIKVTLLWVSVMNTFAGYLIEQTTSTKRQVLIVQSLLMVLPTLQSSKSILHGIGQFEFTNDFSPKKARVKWNFCSLDHRRIEYVVLWEVLNDLNKQHIRYRKHLYLDRNQMHGENEIDYQEPFVGKMDYMMKLRAEMFKSPTSSFHLLMNKGTSVHVFCAKQRLDKDDIMQEMSQQGMEEGDLVMTHIDSFCSNTGQGGYKTLCAEEASLHRAKEIHPNQSEVVLCSDAGSGYKSTQSILGLRNSDEWTGIRVKAVHFNASREGKHWETNGHNSHIKALRKEAMRVGKPCTCTTPRFRLLHKDSKVLLLNGSHSSTIMRSRSNNGMASTHGMTLLYVTMAISECGDHARLALANNSPRKSWTSCTGSNLQRMQW